MKGKYKAAFVIPRDADKVLSDDGWIFESSKRISDELKRYLIGYLQLMFLERYLGIEVYEKSGIKMSILLDDNQQIESIYFQLVGESDSLASLTDACKSYRNSSEVELFVP